MDTEEENMTIAKTILDQMGGTKRLQCMIDAKHFLYGMKDNNNVFVQLLGLFFRSVITLAFKIRNR